MVQGVPSQTLASPWDPQPAGQMDPNMSPGMGIELREVVGLWPCMKSWSGGSGQLVAGVGGGDGDP